MTLFFTMDNVKQILGREKRIRDLLLLLLLLLSCFSRVQLCATAAHQAPPSLGFSRQEHWSGLLFPSPMRESEVAQSCQTLSDPMDCSPPGSSVHGIFQARVLEWGAIAFSPRSHTWLQIECKRRREWQNIRWLGSITDSTDINLSKLWEIVEERGAWHPTVHEITESDMT